VSHELEKLDKDTLVSLLIETRKDWYSANRLVRRLQRELSSALAVADCAMDRVKELEAASLRPRKPSPPNPKR
jgi:hypothetical protein